MCADWARMFEMGSKQQSNSSEAFDCVRTQTLVYIMLNWKLWCCTRLMNLAQNSNSTHVLYIVQPSSAEPTEVMDKHMDVGRVY